MVWRSQLDLKGELALAAAPTSIILAVLALVEVLSRQRLLFASLVGSAFLIYLDPQHGTNTVRTLVAAQMLAAAIGLIAYLLLGDGYLSGGIAMVMTIALMILLDIVHPLPSLLPSVLLSVQVMKVTWFCLVLPLASQRR